MSLDSSPPVAAIPFSIVPRRLERICVFELRGDLGADAAAILEARLAALPPVCSMLVLDLRHLNSIATAGASVLLRAEQRFAAARRPNLALRGAPGDVERALREVGVEDVIIKVDGGLEEGAKVISFPGRRFDAGLPAA